MLERDRKVSCRPAWLSFVWMLLGSRVGLRKGYRPCPRRSSSGKTCTCGSLHHRAERGGCFDTHGQVFPLDEHRGQGRYPTYTLNSNTDTTCRQNGVADQMLHIYQVNALFNFCLFYNYYLLKLVYGAQD